MAQAVSQEIRDTFATRLNAALDETGLPVEGFARTNWLARRLGVTQPTAYKYLHGAVLPGYDLLLKLSECVNTAPDFLVAVGSPYAYLFHDHNGENPITMTLPEPVPYFNTHANPGIYRYWCVKADEALGRLQAGDIIIYETRNVALQVGQPCIVRYGSNTYACQVAAADPGAGADSLSFQFADETEVTLPKSAIVTNPPPELRHIPFYVLGKPLYRFPAGHSFTA